MQELGGALLRLSLHASFGFRFSVFGFRVAGFGVRVSGFGLRVSGFGFRVSGFGFRVSGFGFRGLGFRFQVLGSRFRVSVQCFKVPLRISARTEARAIDGTTQTVCSRALFEISVGCNDVIALQGMSYTSSRGSHKRPYVGVSQVRSWSHWFVLGAILWAFIAKN